MKCESCGKDYPSMYFVKTANICYQCYKKLPNEEKEKLERAIAVQEKIEEKLKLHSRKRFWWGTLSGVVGAIVIRFAFPPWHLFIAPFIGGFVARKVSRGASVGFMSMFIYSILAVLFSFVLPNTFASFTFSTAEFVEAGILSSLIAGVGFGLWPGAVFGMIGGIIGNLVHKIGQQQEMKD